MKGEKESFRSVDQSACEACNSHACHVTGVCESPKRSMPPLLLVHSHTHGQPGRWQRFLFAFRGFRLDNQTNPSIYILYPKHASLGRTLVYIDIVGVQVQQ